eukprot:3974575-Pleurochrysis_carterae.AAC.1
MRRMVANARGGGRKRTPCVSLQQTAGSWRGLSNRAKRRADRSKLKSPTDTAPQRGATQRA